MKHPQILIIVGLLLLIAGISLGGQSPGAAQAATPGATQAAANAAGGAATLAATGAATKVVTPQPITDPLGKPPIFLAKYYQAWVGSPHAKADSEAFKHWDKEGQIPVGCGNCHSTPGYLDFLGADGSAAGKVDNPVPIGSVINCDGCHSPAANALTTVAFPSGAKLGDMGDSTRCIVCHQGRASKVQIDAAIEKAGLTKDVNKVDEKLPFTNIHYFAAAASLYGSAAKGGYEFEGKVYQGRNTHAPGYTTCASCHDSHTLQVKVSECTSCHGSAKTDKDLRNIRMRGSLTDFDGDGSVKEGIAGEIEGLQDTLYKAIQAYAGKVAGKPIVYDAATYPYFFADANSNSKLDEGEKGYTAFTARLLQAAYNYQMSIKDPGSYAHNPKYQIELLYDSIEALNKELGSAGLDLAKIQRDPPGHFAAAGEPFRHWDKEGEVPGSCAKCHTADGLAVYLKNKVNIAAKPSNSLTCATCHDDVEKFTVRPSETVTFPSGAALSFGKRSSANICLNCHQGRESTVSVNNAIKASAVKDDESSEKLAFRNVHYFAAGASLFGSEAQGAYQYEGKKYSGRFMHKKPFQTCTDCHDGHALKVQFNECTDCHDKATKPEDIRADEDTVDYNGNGKADEPIAAEMATFKEELLKQIYAYAAKTAGAAIVYSPAVHPYWFVDKNGDGKADKEETVAENAYKKWTPNLLRAAYNYQYASKDPGAFAHNAGYIMQTLYDSLESVGGKDAVAKFKRPEVRESE